jgi:hypothetical protein
VGRGVAPVIQVAQVGQPGRVRRVGSSQIKEKAATFEILPNILSLGPSIW